MSKTIRKDYDYATIEDDSMSRRVAKTRGKQRPAGRMNGIIAEHLRDIDREELVIVR